ncbi:MAG: hypothetical protein IJZ40_04780 [Bacteroidaceae bacterium]|nr:hypothetical protein [Bacteroidaceae bacterium]
MGEALSKRWFPGIKALMQRDQSVDAFLLSVRQRYAKAKTGWHNTIHCREIQPFSAQ